MYIREKCPLCNSTEIKNYHTLKVDNSFKSFINSYYGENSFENISKFIDDEIIYEQCINCKIVYQKNILSDEGMFELYENIISADSSLEKRLNFSLKHHHKSIKLLSNILTKIDKKVSDIVVVDVGMGFGHMLSYTKALGCVNSYGVELSESRMKYAKDNFGIKSFNSLDKFEDETIDFIIANQSLEHIPNLKDTLDLIERKLSVGGVVYIAVPDGSKKKAFLSKGAFQPLEHINSFIPNSKNFIFSKKIQYKFMLKNLHPNNKTTWLFQKIK